MNQYEINNIINANIELVDEMRILKKENKELKRTIDSAIYCITEGREYDKEDYTTFERNLLEILKGGDF